MYSELLWIQKRTGKTLEVRFDKRKPRMLLRHRTSQNIIEHNNISKVNLGGLLHIIWGTGPYRRNKPRSPRAPEPSEHQSPGAKDP